MRLFSFLLRQQNGREALEDIALLIAVQAAGDAAAEDPPIDFVLHLIAEGEPAGIDAASLFDAEIVAGKAEAGAQTKAREIEPARFVGSILAAAISEFEKLIGERANSRQRPGETAQVRAPVRDAPGSCSGGMPVPRFAEDLVDQGFGVRPALRG